MNYYRLLGITGSIFTLISLAGIPWYQITIIITRETSYVFSFNPFLRVIDLQGKITDYKWFYGIDASLMGVIIAICALAPFTREKEAKWRLVSSLVIFLIMIFFTAFLPISITTASRLSFGAGLIFAGLGAIIIGLSYIFRP